MLIDRPEHLTALGSLLRHFPVVSVLGPRQVGKTTLARQVYDRRGGRGDWFDCEDPRDLARLGEPMLALSRTQGLIVIDEIQRRPELFPALRVLADRRPIRTRFLVLGSASGDLLRQSSESLAGRVAYHELPALTPREVGLPRMRRLWLRGGFPRSFTPRSLQDSVRWRREFIRTFLEQDLPQMGVRVPAASLRRFWSMLAHVHANLLNWSELGRSLGVTDHVVRGYCDLLEQTFMVRTLKPWHDNLDKRQVKAPKIYLRDTGVLHTLLDIQDQRQLERHPKVGASFEGFFVESLVAHLGARPEECFFWRTHAGAELDLLVVRGRTRRGFEIKLSEKPVVTPSMRTALKDLRLDHLDVIHAGSETFPLADEIRAVSMDRVWQDVKPLRGS